VWDLTHSLRASGLAAALLILDIGMLVLNRYILLGNIHFQKENICHTLKSKLILQIENFFVA
jgi:hypothetical protein